MTVLADNHPVRVAIHTLWPNVAGHDDGSEIDYQLPTELGAGGGPWPAPTLR